MQDEEHAFYKRPSQHRSEQAVRDIFEAARVLVSKNESGNLSARNLANRSGYSVGAIYRYFEKIDDVFTNIFITRRKVVFQQLIEKIEVFPPTASADLLIEIIVNHSMQTWSGYSYTVIKIVSRQFFKRAKEPEQFNKTIDVLIPSLTALIRQNVTGTFKKMTQFDLQMNVRCIQTAIRSPFMEGDVNAGGAEHRRVVHDIATALFIRPEVLLGYKK